ncbi:MAG: GNAT family N-acetyltransferase [Candidatus Bathyarchaeia archaeon]
MISSRKVNPSDLPALREIASTAFKHHRYWLDAKLDRERIREYYIKDLEKLVKDAFDNPRENHFIVLVDEGKIVGYIALRIDTLLTNTFGFKWGVISSFALSEEYRLKGIGHKALLEALEWFKEKGVSRVDVWTDAENIAAIQCYEKSGFRTIYNGVILTLNLSN